MVGQMTESRSRGVPASSATLSRVVRAGRREQRRAGWPGKPCGMTAGGPERGGQQEDKVSWAGPVPWQSPLQVRGLAIGSVMDTQRPPALP